MSSPRWILLALALMLLAYEVYAVLNDGSGDTISEVFWHFSKRPLVPFLTGVVCGHLFWPK